MSEFDFSREIAVITVIAQRGLDAGLVGKKKFFSPGGEAGGLSAAWLEEQAARLAREALAGGVFAVFEVADPAGPGRTATVMVEPYLPSSELVILGGGHISLPLAKLGKMLGYRVAVADDRADFASPARFPEVDRVVCCSFENIRDRLGFGPGSSVVIVTRGHQHDLDCLRQVAGYPLAYLGMIGSRRKIRMIKQQLTEEGFSEKDLEAVHMPIGLDIGAQTPEEIAVSIAAELVMVRRGGSARPLNTGPAEAGAEARSFQMPSSMDLEILSQAVKSAGGEVPAALATIVRTWGSTPRKAGARMIIYRDGRASGTIGGGCGESEVRREALNVMDESLPRLYRVALDADTAADEGMVCGGAMEVFIETTGVFSCLAGGGDVVGAR